MKRTYTGKRVAVLLIGVCLILLAAGPALSAAFPGPAQEKPEEKITQTAGVDNSTMGMYRTLAQLSGIPKG